MFFYGAGCGTVEAPKMLKRVLESIFTNAAVEVKEDTYAAIYSTVGSAHSPAVVCILGTGSNCTYFDGENVDQRITSLGYILMDDASGNYFGRQLLRDYYFNRIPEEIAKKFEAEFDLSAETIKDKLYKQPDVFIFFSNINIMMIFFNKFSSIFRN